MNKEILHSYFSGNATKEEEVQLLDWLKASPENYPLYLKERKSWNAILLHLPSQKIDELHGKRRNTPVYLWKIGTIAASIALILSLLGVFPVLKREKGGEHSIIVPPGQRVQLKLDDGTEVWLNSQSIFTYPSFFDSDSRKVTLEGEGFFVVSPDKKRPFIVQTRNYDLHVLGTTFNVSLYGTADHFEAALLEGSVSIHPSGNTKQLLLLSPNESAKVQDGILKKYPISNMDRFRWKDGLICLDDEPFDGLMFRFSEYYDVKIHIDNKRLNAYRCTGKFRLSDGLDYALRVLQRDLNFKYNYEEDTRTITIY